VTRAAPFFVAAVLALAGCDELAGIDVHQLAPRGDASGDGSGPESDTSTGADSGSVSDAGPE